MIEDYKQVLVVRQKFPDGNGKFTKMRRGKEISQAAHSSLGVILKNKILLTNCGECLFLKADDSNEATHLAIPLSEPLKAWLLGLFKKIAVSVDTEEELLALQKQADDAGILNVLIEDSGLTEFHGVKTKTVLAIGPDLSEKIDKITGRLKLL